MINIRHKIYLEENEIELPADPKKKNQIDFTTFQWQHDYKKLYFVN